MLTTMFYYDYYRPYILRDGDKGVRMRERAAPPAAMADGKPVRLNKTLNSGVVEFARDVSANVNGFREATRDALRAIERFDRAAAGYGEDAALRHFSEAAADFAEAYTGAQGFLAAQGHSSRLLAFKERVAETAAAHSGALALAGLRVEADGGSVSFRPETASQDRAAAQAAIKAARPALEELMDEALSLLKAPLTEHMNFKSFRYYYNYNRGMTQSETFNIIGAGTLIDVAL